MDFLPETCGFCAVVSVSDAEFLKNSSEREFFNKGQHATTKPLRKCGRCHIVAYCSQEHQKADFATHRAICKAIQAMDAAFHAEAKQISEGKDAESKVEKPKGEGKTGKKGKKSKDKAKAEKKKGTEQQQAQQRAAQRRQKETERYHRVIKERRHLALALARPLSSAEISLVIHRPACLECCVRPKETTVSGQTAVLSKCPCCHVALFCQDHANHKDHRPYCTTYDLLLKCEQVIRDFQRKKENLTWIPTPQEGFEVCECSYKRLQPGWDRYWKRRNAPVWMYSPLLKLFTTHLSLPLTILWALGQKDIAEMLEPASRQSLTIHVIGATVGFELQFMDKYEEILHLLPECKKLNLVFVGPELPTPRPGDSRRVGDRGMRMTQPLCPACPQSKQLQCLTFTARYDAMLQDWKKDSAEQLDYTEPQLCVAFNSGVHLFTRGSEKDSWHSTLLRFQDEKWAVPTIWTAYSRDECVFTAARLESYGCRFVLPPQENPFASMYPMREPTGLTSSPFYYHNGQVMATLGASDPISSTWQNEMEKLPNLELIRQSQV